jgi:inositol oxygenase
VLKNHGATLPDEAMYMIRFHSFYPWHTGGAYKQFDSEYDQRMIKWVNEFNKFDL